MLQRIMETKGISPMELSRLTGLPPATIYRHLNGTRGVSSQCARKYANALRVTIDDVLSEDAQLKCAEG
jgi:predicted transcriptional regulator